MGQAYLEFSEWGSSAGAFERFNFPFNPNQLTVGEAAGWKGDDPRHTSQFVGQTRRSMTIKIFLDERVKPDENGPNVVSAVDLLLSACRPIHSDPERPLPPRVKFGWDRVYIDGYAVSVNANYLLFSPDGQPVRAECDVTLQECRLMPTWQNPSSGTRNIHRTVELVAGDHLAHVAYKEYGKSSRWRDIADLNGVDDPMRVPPGTPLLVPRAPETGART